MEPITRPRRGAWSAALLVVAYVLALLATTLGLASYGDGFYSPATWPGSFHAIYLIAVVQVLGSIAFVGLGSALHDLLSGAAPGSPSCSRRSPPAAASRPR